MNTSGKSMDFGKKLSSGTTVIGGTKYTPILEEEKVVVAQPVAKPSISRTVIGAPVKSIEAVLLPVETLPPKPAVEEVLLTNEQVVSRYTPESVVTPIVSFTQPDLAVSNEKSYTSPVQVNKPSIAEVRDELKQDITHEIEELEQRHETSEEIMPTKAVVHEEKTSIISTPLIAPTPTLISSPQKELPNLEEIDWGGEVEAMVESQIIPEKVQEEEHFDTTQVFQRPTIVTPIVPVSTPIQPVYTQLPTTPILEPVKKEMVMQEQVSSQVQNFIVPTTLAKKPVAKRTNATLSLVKKILLALVLGLVIVAAAFFVYQSLKANKDLEENKVLNDTRLAGELSTKYKTWSYDVVKKVVKLDDDEDKDGLTNYTEFMLGSKPNEAFSCSGNLNDSKTLYAFIDPSTCNKIDLSTSANLKKYQNFINFNDYSKVIESSPVQKPISVVGGDSLETVFDTKDISKISIDSLKSNYETFDSVKKEYAKKIIALNSYFLLYRSSNIKDKDNPIPLSAAQYLDASLKYKIELKYLVAVAQKESSFGTLGTGETGVVEVTYSNKNLTGFGRAENGQSVWKFDNWETGLFALAKWYQKLGDAGVIGCDRCEKTENQAKVFEEYFIAYAL
jgi:hypothetical protein